VTEFDQPRALTQPQYLSEETAERRQVPLTKVVDRAASHHHLRPRIIPPSAIPAPELQLTLDLPDAANDAGEAAEPRRLGWANLLARVFAATSRSAESAAAACASSRLSATPKTSPACSTAPELRRDRHGLIPQAKFCCSPFLRALLASPEDPGYVRNISCSSGSVRRIPR
jgi:hypothetical protein